METDLRFVKEFLFALKSISVPNAGEVSCLIGNIDRIYCRTECILGEIREKTGA